MKRFYLIASAVIALFMAFAGNLNAQTSGTLTFSVTTTEPSGGYTGVNCLAIWIENSSGTFIKTKMRYAQARVSYLNVWISKSSQNVVDAITGATLNSHGTRTITWNATNVSATLVPDDTYKIWMQMADRNQNGATASITFVKGPTPITNQTFANSGNFTNMTLNWVPTGIGITETPAVNDLSVFPNPFSSELNVTFSLSDAQRVSAAVYDTEGRLVKMLADNMLTEGSHSINWDASDNEGSKVAQGIYFIKISSGSMTTVKKVFYRK